MYGDTATIRRLADQMTEQAGDIRADADELVSVSQLVVWDGKAATAMRERMMQRAVALRRTADQHDDAAVALQHHAAEVDRLQERIADIARTVAGLVDAARTRLADLADRAMDLARTLLPDPVDEMLAGFRPPPADHKDWLEVPDRLPGAFW